MNEFLREIPGPMGPLEALLDLPDWRASRRRGVRASAAD